MIITVVIIAKMMDMDIVIITIDSSFIIALEFKMK